jgi:hypothetical protein
MIIAAVKNGEDPAANRNADRQAITVKELVERFEKEHVALRVKESTAKGYSHCAARALALEDMAHGRRICV